MDKPRSTLCSEKSDAKIQITITMAYLIRIKYPLSSFNYHLSVVNIAHFNKIHRRDSEQQLFHSDKICRSYSDFNIGVTFFGTQCIITRLFILLPIPNSFCPLPSLACCPIRVYYSSNMALVFIVCSVLLCFM